MQYLKIKISIHAKERPNPRLFIKFKFAKDNSTAIFLRVIFNLHFNGVSNSGFNMYTAK